MTGVYALLGFAVGALSAIAIQEFVCWIHHRNRGE